MPYGSGMSPDELEGWLSNPKRRPVVMGVLNATPDSFSDGGRYLSAGDAAARVKQMVKEGVDWIDIGGESTRPGSESVDTEVQIARVMPAIRAAVSAGIVTSIDTADVDVASAALEAGATIINDITAADNVGMFAVMKRAAAVVLMHMRGRPGTMQNAPMYEDVVEEVERFLLARRDAAARAGIEIHRILLDPGIGFGKTVGHNLELLAATRRLVNRGSPVLIGASRKRFIGTITNEPQADQRLFGTAATVAWAIAHGAAVVRVHDVKAMRQVLDMTWATMNPDMPHHVTS